MVKPLLRYNIEPDTLNSIGLIIVESAHIEFLIEETIRASVAHGLIKNVDPRGRSVNWKIERLKDVAKNTVDPLVVHLIRELRWSMITVRRIRNILAHGIVLTDDKGRPSFWSQWKLQEMQVDEVAVSLPVVQYAAHVAAHLNWTVLSIRPPQALPDRPS